MTDPFAAHRPRPSVPAPEPLEGRRPRMLAHVLRYFDWHPGGAERMLHGVLRGLQDRGWDVAVVTMEYANNRYDYEWDGVPVTVLPDARLDLPYTWCDVALTHLDVTSHAMAWARYGRPLTQLVHNHMQLTHHRVLADGINYPIWNSLWIEEDWKAWAGPSIVCRPPLVMADHATVNEDRHAERTATILNLLGIKGGDIFWRLARRMPEWRFLGVDGAYGAQVHCDPMPPNGEIAPNSTETRDVWQRTSVYLQPSYYESYGLAAVEALCSGIPVIAAKTPGLIESMTSPTHGPCAIHCNHDDDQEWYDALRSLEDPAVWAKWSRLALLRARELTEQTVTDLDRLDVFARSLAEANAAAFAARTIDA